MSLQEKAARFSALHQADQPLVLTNVWDAGSAKAVAAAGASALATSSWAIAAAHGYEDGEALPLALAIATVERIARTSPLPVSADIEGGYGDTPQDAARTLQHFMDAGVVGINFEDRRVHGPGLFDMDEHASRIAAMRAVADKGGIAIFINARTDIFFGGGGDTRRAALMDKAVARAHAYAAAGANGLFVPGLSEPDLICDLCARVCLPVNIMMSADTPSLADLARLGVRRMSTGPGTYLAAMASVTQSVERMDY